MTTHHAKLWFRLTTAALLFVTTITVRAEGLAPAFTAQLGTSLGRYLGDRFEIHKKLGIPRYEYVGWPPRRVHYSGPNQFKQLNLIVDVPKKPWICLGPTKKEQPKSILLSRKKPKINIAVNAQPFEYSEILSYRDLLNQSHVQIESTYDGTVLPGSCLMDANGMQGVGHEAVITLKDGADAHCAVWIAAEGGYLYNVVVFGEKRNRKAINQTMNSFLARLSPIHRVIPTQPQSQSPKNNHSRASVKKDDSVVWVSENPHWRK